MRGDSSCAELTHHIHCRNCPVHAAAAVALLEGPAPADYLAGWASHVADASPARRSERETRSVVIFRVGAEWLSLRTPVVQEVTSALPIHSLPHRRRDVVLGLTNVRGELVVCVSLPRILGLEESAESDPGGTPVAGRRFLVIRDEDIRAVSPVDEVHGIFRFHPRDMKDLPTTLAKASTKYSTGLLSWREHSVAVLDDQSLFSTLKRSLA